MNKRNFLAMTVLLVLALGTPTIGAAPAPAAPTPPPFDQPHMQAALDHLRAAKADLDQAPADKGGHRVRALQLVKNAIAEVDKGIEYDRTH